MLIFRKLEKTIAFFAALVCLVGWSAPNVFALRQPERESPGPRRELTDALSRPASTGLEEAPKFSRILIVASSGESVRTLRQAVKSIRPQADIGTLVLPYEKRQVSWFMGAAASKKLQVILVPGPPGPGGGDDDPILGPAIQGFKAAGIPVQFIPDSNPQLVQPILAKLERQAAGGLAGFEEESNAPEVPVDPLFAFRLLRQQDPKVFELLMRQYGYFNRAQTFIASEAHTDPLVLASMALAQGLAMKYGEGFPPPTGKRYYPGLKEVLDELEDLARNRVVEVFEKLYPDVKRRFRANVQLHSGSGANLAVYFSVLNPGDGKTPPDGIAALDLAHGGHLSHGFKANISGRVFKIFRFGVDPRTGAINYDQLESDLLKLPAKERPRLLVLGGTAVARQIDWTKARRIADNVTHQNTKDGYPATMLLVADISHNLGMILAGDYNNPFPDADFVTATTHKTRGDRHAVVLSRTKVIPEVNQHRGLKGKALGETTLADLLDRAVLPGSQGGQSFPKIAATAVWALVLQSPEFLEYARQILPNARALSAAIRAADTEHRAEFFGPEVPETHMMLMRWKGLTGKQMEAALESVDLLANSNLMPGPDGTTLEGIRVGVPGPTSRGMKGPEMAIFGRLFVETLQNTDPVTGQVEPAAKAQILNEVHRVTGRFEVLKEWRALFHQVDREVETIARETDLALLELATAVFSRSFQKGEGFLEDRIARRISALGGLWNTRSIATLPLLQGILRDTSEPNVVRAAAAQLLPNLSYTHTSQVDQVREALDVFTGGTADPTWVQSIQTVLTEKRAALVQNESVGMEEKPAGREVSVGQTRQQQAPARFIFRPQNAGLALLVPEGIEHNVWIICASAEQANYLLDRRPALNGRLLPLTEFGSVEAAVGWVKRQQDWAEASDVQNILPKDPDALRRQIQKWVAAFGWAMPDLGVEVLRAVLFGSQV